METHEQSSFLGLRSRSGPGCRKSIRKWEVGRDTLYFVIVIANSRRKRRARNKRTQGTHYHRQVC